MSWQKYRDQLSNLLELIENTQDKELYLILWLKVYRICIESIRNFDLPQKQKQILIGLIEKYKTKIQPSLGHFFRDQKNTPMNLVLKQFTDQLFHQFKLAEENIKTLPLKSLEILENTLFMVDLFQFTLNKSIINTSKEIIRNKITLLRQDFEVEGGSKDIEQQQKQLTQAYLNQIQGSSFPEPVAMPEIKESEIDQQSSDIVLGTLSFPEETIKNAPLTAPATSISPIDSLITPLKSDSNILSYDSWYPKENWTQFIKIRYDSSTGRIQKSS